MSQQPQEQQAQANEEKGFDYSHCQMHCRLYQKGIFSKTKINLFVFNNRLILTEKAYDKAPKRVIDLDEKDLVKWHVERKENSLNYTGFTIVMRKEKEDKSFEKKGEIELLGESIQLEQLKLHLSKFIFQSRFQDEYVVRSQIGKGSYARVFSARHRVTGHKIAVKCFEKLRMLENKSGYATLFKEIKIMRTIGQNPHLIDIIGCYEGDNTFYVAMEIFEGNSLYQEIKQHKTKRFTLAEIQLIMKQILSGVKHFTSLGIMHRDIKPDNIMFRNKDSLEGIAIVDFGLSEFENAQEFLFTKCGTPGYAAPEVVNFKEGLPLYNSKCDLFSVGVIFHILIFNQPVFTGGKFNQLLQMNKECKINYEDKMYSSASPRTLDLLKKLLAPNPEQRCSAQEALDHDFFLEEPEEENAKNDFKYSLHADNILESGSRCPTDSQGLKSPCEQEATGSPTGGQGINSFNQKSSEVVSSFYHNAYIMFHRHSDNTSKSSINQSNALSNLSNSNIKNVNTLYSQNSAKQIDNNNNNSIGSKNSIGNQVNDGSAQANSCMLTSTSPRNITNMTSAPDMVASIEKHLYLLTKNKVGNGLNQVAEVEEEAADSPGGNHGLKIKIQLPPKQSHFKNLFNLDQKGTLDEDSPNKLPSLGKGKSSIKTPVVNIVQYLQFEETEEQCDKSVDVDPLELLSPDINLDGGKYDILGNIQSHTQEFVEEEEQKDPSNNAIQEKAEELS